MICIYNDMYVWVLISIIVIVVCDLMIYGWVMLIFMICCFLICIYNYLYVWVLILSIIVRDVWLLMFYQWTYLYYYNIYILIYIYNDIDWWVVIVIDVYWCVKSDEHICYITFINQSISHNLYNLETSTHSIYKNESKSIKWKALTI